MKGAVIVSACLLGLMTRHDGGHATSKEAMAELEGLIAIPVCPEQLGGLPTPRPKAEIKGGSGNDVLDGNSVVTDSNGADVTAAFMKGAEAAAKIAEISGAMAAYLKEKSPSCGASLICRANDCVPGQGVTAAILRRKGMPIKGF